MITLVATVCHSLAGITTPVCHEEIVTKGEIACAQAQMVIADWKAHTIYRGDNWSVRGYRCAYGDYVLKENI